MATVFKLSHNVLTDVEFNDEFKWTPDGLEFKTGEGEPFWETYKLITKKGLTDAQIRGHKDSLDRMIQGARDYHADPTIADPVWLYIQSDGESAKRVLVYDGVSTLQTVETISPMLGTKGALYLTVGFLRHHVFENTTVETETQSGVSTLGGGTVEPMNHGSAPGRIQRALMTSSGSTWDEYWLGIKRGDGTGVVTLWEAEDGANVTDASDVVDGTASGGDNVTVSFSSDTDMVERMNIKIDDVSGAAAGMMGNWLVLCRCKVDNANTQVAIDLKYGWLAGSHNAKSAGITYIDGDTNWLLRPLGTVTFPPGGNREALAATYVTYQGLSLWAERISASGSLLIDCFVFIPMDAMVHGKGCHLGGATTHIGVHFYTTPEDTYWAAALKTGATQYYNIEAGFAEGLGPWEMPNDAGYVVVAAQGLTAHALSETLSYFLYFYPRWHSYRDT
jgi:hypothetical protein